MKKEMPRLSVGSNFLSLSPSTSSFVPFRPRIHHRHHHSLFIPSTQPIVIVTTPPSTWLPKRLLVKHPKTRPPLKSTYAETRDKDHQPYHHQTGCARDCSTSLDQNRDSSLWAKVALLVESRSCVICAYSFVGSRSTLLPTTRFPSGL